MSRLLISRNPDLQRLQNEGFEIEVRSNHLLVHAVPYVNSHRQVALGILISELSMISPEVLGKPSTHQMHFVGDHPCNPDGSELTQIKNGTGDYRLTDDLSAQHYFSNKPQSGAYDNYYDKITSYVRVISNQARAIDPTADAKTFKVIEPVQEDSVFLYADTASSRAGIQRLANKLKHQRIAIIGLGGTGAYVLDLVAKTHVREIHLYDGDAFHQHNAFRSPCAASIADLERKLSKVHYLAEKYGVMRTNIVAHDVMITEANVAELANYDFIFICVDKGTVRKLIIDALEQQATCFIDVGMGVNMTDDGEHLWGTCRVTTSYPETRTLAATSIPKVDRDEELYGSNIQIADLNCLNATLAVIKWKRWSGFYFDDRSEHESTFNLSLNQLSNKEPA